MFGESKKIDYKYALFFNCGTEGIASNTHVAVRVKGGRKNQRAEKTGRFPSFSFRPENELYGEMNCMYVVTSNETLQPTHSKNRQLGQILRGCSEIEEWLNKGDVQHYYSYQGSRVSQLPIYSYEKFSDLRHSEFAAKRFVHTEGGKCWVWIEDGRQRSWDKITDFNEDLTLHLVDPASFMIKKCVLSFGRPYDSHEDGFNPPVYRDININVCIQGDLPRQIIRGGQTIRTSGFETGCMLDVHAP